MLKRSLLFRDIDSSILAQETGSETGLPKVPQLVSARVGLKLVCEFCLLKAVPSDLAHGEG